MFNTIDEHSTSWSERLYMPPPICIVKNHYY